MEEQKIKEFFPNPYPDEFFYSIIARYHKRSRNKSYVQTIKKLFGKNYQVTLFTPKYLDNLCANISEISNYNKRQFIENNTIFPVYRPFLTEEIKYKILDLIGSGGKTLIPGFNKDDEITCIKYCNKCISEDRERYGEAYLHRMHQIKNIHYCPIHNKILNEIPLNKDHFINIEDIDINQGKQSVAILDDNREFHFTLSKNIEVLLSKDFLNINLNSVRLKYWAMLEQRGYVTPKNKIRYKKFYQDFLDYYPNSFLKEVQHEVNIVNPNDWLKKVLTNTEKIIDPVSHLLLINFLFNNINNFINADEYYYPFGKGPWPCLNPTASHYLKDVINDCLIRKTHQGNNVYGYFKCDCGYTYRRKGPDMNVSDRYKKSSVASYGKVWKDMLIQELQTNKSIKNIGKIMGCDGNTVIKYTKLLTKSSDNDNIIQNKKIDTDINQIKIKHREEIKNYINKNPNYTRSQLYYEVTTAYKYLIANDKQWFENILPPKSVFKGDRINWKDRDVILADKIRTAAEEILKENEVRVTLPKIQEKIDYFRLKANLYRLPMCNKILSEKLETYSDFRKRFINFRVEKKLEQGKSINKSKVYQYSGKINGEEIKEYIDKVVREKTEKLRLKKV